MKINEELERLLGTEAFRQQAHKVGNSGGEGFEGLLAQQMRQADASSPADPRLMQALSNPLRLANVDIMSLNGVQAADTLSGDRDALASLSESIASTLDGFDQYAAGLRDAGPAGLREAWNSLERLEESIAGLRQDMSKLSQPDAELEAMISEMEILATTEKFKFNRGDYLTA